MCWDTRVPPPEGVTVLAKVDDDDDDDHCFQKPVADSEDLGAPAPRARPAGQTRHPRQGAHRPRVRSSRRRAGRLLQLAVKLSSNGFKYLQRF